MKNGFDRYLGISDSERSNRRYVFERNWRFRFDARFVGKTEVIAICGFGVWISAHFWCGFRPHHSSIQQIRASADTYDEERYGTTI
jgi:hypothetical protein